MLFIYHASIMHLGDLQDERSKLCWPTKLARLITYCIDFFFIVCPNKFLEQNVESNTMPNDILVVRHYVVRSMKLREPTTFCVLPNAPAIDKRTTTPHWVMSC
jgi:hypothetical protein